MKKLSMISMVTVSLLLSLFKSGFVFAVQSQAEIERIALKKVEKELGFIIPKNMHKKLNAIQWTFKASKDGRKILSGNHYRLVNMVVNQGISHQKRLIGANVGLLKKNSKKYNVLVKLKKKKGQVRYGDVVALNLKPYGWLRYKKQRRGINFGDSDKTPHYVWKINGGPKGKKLVSGMPFVLHMVNKWDVIYCQRDTGPDFGWRGKSKCGSISAKLSGAVFGANGALSSGGLKGAIAKKWKSKLCKTAINAGASAVNSTSSGVASPLIDNAKRRAINKCKSI